MSKPYKLIKAQFGVAPLNMRFEDWFQLPVHPTTFEEYRQDAKQILDTASKDLKPIGIQMLLAALIDLVESEYWGEHNNSVYQEKTSDEIEAEAGGP